MRNMESYYWTHNAAYYPWIIKQIGCRDRVLDVGCGDGLLVKQIAVHCSHVVGLEPHMPSAEAARKRLCSTPNATVHAVPLEQYDAKPGTFDAVVFVASLHHMEQRAGIQRAVELLAPGGVLLVVGCARPEGAADWLLEGLRVIPAKIGSLLHGEKNGGTIGVPVQQPDLSLAQIDEIARIYLPGRSLRRGLYYRYLLSWIK